MAVTELEYWNMRQDFDKLRKAYGELLSILPDGEGYGTFIDGGEDALRELDKKYPICDHDMSFDGESSDHTKGFFSCTKCGYQQVSVYEVISKF